MWERQRGTTRSKRRAQRIYRLDELRPVEGVAGRPRVATGEHRSLLIDWTEAFAKEALGDAPAPDTERAVDGRLRGPGTGFLIWEDEDPVSMAGWGGATPSGIRIGPVYTPPDRRGRGYGSAVTAALSRKQLDAGRRFCFLYTDLANPTSNKIYMDLGYEPVCDSVEYVFDPA
jgi:predicted GNAT family acetyltransferase